MFVLGSRAASMMAVQAASRTRSLYSGSNTSICITGLDIGAPDHQSQASGATSAAAPRAISPSSRFPRCVLLKQGEQSPQQLDRPRGAAGDAKVDGQNFRNRTHAGVAVCKYSTGAGAIANRYDPFWIRRRPERSLKGFPHVLRDWPGNQQYVRMSRRGDKPDPEALDVVVWVIQGMDFEFTRIAGSGIHLPDRETSSKPAAGLTLEGAADFLQLHRARRGRNFSRRCTEQISQESLAHNVA